MNHSLCCVVCLLIGSVACTGCSDSAPVSVQEPSVQLTPLQQATQAWHSGDLPTARQAIRQALLVEPESFTVHELAGDIEKQAGDLGTAISHYREAVQKCDQPSPQLFDKLGRNLMSAGRPFDAADTLQQAVATYPQERNFRVDLIGLLMSLGREPEAGPHLQWMIMRGQGTLDMLSVASDLTRSQVDEEICRYALKHAPDDLRPQYGLTRKQAFHREWAEVANSLNPVIAQHPQFLIAQAYYVRALAELDDQPRFEQWQQATPVGIEREPQYWKALGIWAERHNQLQAAATAYHQACHLDPNDVESHNQLAFTLAALGRSDEAELPTKRAAELARVRELVDAIKAAPKESKQTMITLASTMEQLGRLWESAAWLRGAASMNAQPEPSLVAAYAKIHRRLSAQTPWQLPEFDVAIQLRKLRPESWPHSPQDTKVDWNAIVSSAPSKTNPKTESLSTTIRFADVAKETGLEHWCKIREPENPRAGVWIYQVSAGARQ